MCVCVCRRAAERKDQLWRRWAVWSTLCGLLTTFYSGTCGKLVFHFKAQGSDVKGENVAEEAGKLLRKTNGTSCEQRDWSYEDWQFVRP